MRKQLFYFLIISLNLLITRTDFLRSQEWITSNVINGSRIEPKKSVFDESDNSVYTFSNFSDTVFLGESIVAKGGNDILISKFDSDGNIVWNYHIESKESLLYNGISLKNDGSIVIAASFSDTCWFEDNSFLVSTGNYDIFIVQLDRNGGLVWSKPVGTSSPDQYILDIKTDLNNDILLTGIFKDTVVIDTDLDQEIIISPQSNFLTTFVVKLDENAESILWSKQISSSSQSSNIRRINISSDGYYFGGVFRGSITLGANTFNSVNGSLDAFVFNTDLNGNILWSRQISGSSNEFLLNLRADEYDNIYVVGNYISSSLTIDSTDTEESIIPVNKGGYDTYICKYNKSGILQWSLTKGGTATDVYNDFSIRNNFMYSTGLFAEEIIFNVDTLTTDSPTNSDAFIASFNSIGDPISGASIIGSGIYDDKGVAIHSDFNNNAYIIGYFRSPDIKIGESTFYNSNPGNSNLFYAQFAHPFKAAFTNENIISCQGYSDGMLTVTPYFGVPPYTYNWTKDGSPYVETDSVAEGLNAGLYRVSITDSRDSITTVQVSLTNPAPLSIGYVTNEVSCYEGSDGVIDITATGGNNNYLYNWSGGSGLSPTSEDQTGLIAADYFVTVTDIKGCTATRTITLGQAAPLTFDETIITSTNADVDTGRVDLVVNGGTLPYTAFAWNGPDGYTSIEESIDSLNGGIYSVTVTDANSCVGDTTFLVPNDSIFIAYMTQVRNVTCGDSTNGYAVVSSNRSEWAVTFEYLWIDLEDSLQIGSNQDSISGLDSSQYRVYVIDKTNFDTTHVEFKITKPKLLTVSSDAAAPLCNGGSNGYINAIVSGGKLPYTYEWSNGPTTEDLNNLQAGTYSITVTDSNSCVTTIEEILEDPETINITFDFTNPICPGTLTGAATANVTGGGLIYYYAWNDSENQTDSTAINLRAGTYTVSVTDQYGCLETDVVTLTNPSPVSVASINSGDASCFGISDGWMKVTATGGSGSYTYNWSNIGLGTDSVGNIGAGTYDVTVNDINNCIPVIETITINEPAEIIVDIDTVDNTCFGESNGQIAVTPTGGSGSFDYTWGHTAVNTGVVASLAAGTYYLTLSDGICPDLTYDIPVVEPTEIAVLIDTTDISCLNAADGEITITTTGGTGNYSYAWSHSAITDASITVAEPGNYTVTINDGACPELIYTIPINEPEEFLISTNKGAVTCYNGTDGSIQVNITGGSENYDITWGHTAAKVALVTNLGTGSYSVTVDDGSCPAKSETIEITEPDELLITDYDTVNLSAAGAQDGQIILHVIGGTEPYTYALNSGPVQGDSIFSNLDVGKYRAEVNDANNCGLIYTDSIEITVPTSVESNYWEESVISYYPNPADDKVTIEINDLKTNSVNLKIVNSMGSLLMNKAIEIPNKYNLIELETMHLSQGIYFILVDNKRVKTPLVIK